MKSQIVRANGRYSSRDKTSAASHNARAANAVGTIVGVPRGTKKERDCQSKLYPQHAPLKPFRLIQIRSSSSSRASASFSLVGLRRKSASAASANSAIAFALRSRGTPVNERKLIGE